LWYKSDESGVREVFAVSCAGGMEVERRMVEVKTVYFERKGPENTEETLRLVRTRAEERGLRDIVVASQTGATGARRVRCSL
jgi:hypothetical protein